MSNFYENLKNTQDNMSVTEKGMVGYKHTNHALVDFNFGVASYRNNIVKANQDFARVLKEKEEYVLKYLFYLRDAREGIGERNLFRACIRQLLASNVAKKDEIASIIIEQTPEFGRWDDLWLFLDTQYKEKVIEVIRTQLRSDYANYKANKSISLLAKWLPSANASKKETKRLANLVIAALKTTPREYRKVLSTLRAYIDVTEVKTCGNEWEEIDYNKVPSKANLKYKNAFLKHDEERRRAFLSKAIAGDKTVKVHMAVGFPHEIVHQYSDSGWGSVKGYDQSLEAYWKNLKPCVGLKDTIVVRDGSGSMSSSVGGTKVTALEISTALALYCAENLEGGFKNKFITFDNNAKLVDLTKAGSLHSKLEVTYRFDECGTTNIENVFELILAAAYRSQMKPEEMPSTVLIISDMEFDPAGGRVGWHSGMNAGTNVFESMNLKFKQYGYKLPKLAFWNVNSRTQTIPCTYNENGVLLISGFSQNVLNMVMNGKTDPYDALIEELNRERYAKIPLVGYVDNSPKTVKKVTKANTPDFLK